MNTLSNNVLETIKKRRSVRKFLQEKIKQEELDAIIEAGIYAASGHNSQPWHFTVIENKEFINEMNDKTKEAMRASDIDWIRKMGEKEKLHILGNAPMVIIVSGRQENAYSPLTDCANAIQNMLVAAESLDIGTCYIGLTEYFFKDDENLKTMNIPDGYVPYYTVSIGYKDPAYAWKAPVRNEDVVNYIR
ncbi:MAG: nitroreductase family protein [Peptostreptococcaceae bacterium]|nr:nitroreductase family protein [Peptostreptococcaceae bacterium]